MYAFDVHCNSYFPLFISLYGEPVVVALSRALCAHTSFRIALAVVQFFLSPLLLAHGLLSVILSNLLYAASLAYYHYTQFLGYSALPFLERTELFLYPIGLLLVATPFSMLAGFNPSRFTLGLYFGSRG